ncbi:MAG TPA: decarboxylating 6-phosphogluconate dehydrogenase [Thermotogae bacterium]|nr:6-phosphogluconate dehydrogenase [Thermotogota bacterium]HCZ05555.1 decarboxylating 6-phosphogluconate dehydrogenase [Thermotogota bacterium]
MKLGLIGLGRMGMNMAKRLIKHGHEVVCYDSDLKKTEEIKKEGAIGVGSVEELIDKLASPRIVWLMLPFGDPTEDTIKKLSGFLEPGDVLINGANDHYRNDIRRKEELNVKGIHYMDVGVSGGVWGFKFGYNLMVGGEKEDFDYIEPLLKALAPEGGYLHCGPCGAGHFVKMVHNAVMYGIMEAYAEGFEVLKASSYSNYFTLEDVAHLWNNGSVIRSWLLELLESAFAKDPELEGIQGYVEDSGEARWMVKEAVDLGVSVTGIAHALFKRFESRQEDVFSNKVIAALRKEFGGHRVYRKGERVRKEGAGAGQVETAKPDIHIELP